MKRKWFETLHRENRFGTPQSHVLRPLRDIHWVPKGSQGTRSASQYRDSIEIRGAPKESLRDNWVLYPSIQSYTQVIAPQHKHPQMPCTGVGIRTKRAARKYLLNSSWVTDNTQAFELVRQQHAGATDLSHPKKDCKLPYCLLLVGGSVAL